MGRGLLREIWGFVFWTHERGSLRYDVMLALILAFIFLTPRSFFRDRPEPAAPEQIVALDRDAFRLEAATLGREQRNLEGAAQRLLRAFTGKPVRVRRLRPVWNDDGRLVAYEVWIEEK